MAEKFYYVDPINGHDDIFSYDGESKVNAFKSIGYAAIHGIPDGNLTIIHCRQGIYTISSPIEININSGVSSSLPILFLGDYKGDIWIEDGVGAVKVTGNGEGGFHIDNVQHNHIKGFEISGFSSYGIKVEHAHSLTTSQSKIESCFIENINTASGNVYGIWKTSFNLVSIINIIISNISTDSGTARGIYDYSSGPPGPVSNPRAGISIKNCSIYNISGTGSETSCFMWYQAGFQHDNISIHNTILQKSTHSIMRGRKFVNTPNVTSDYNQFFKDGATDLVNFYGVSYADLDGWDDTGRDINSQEGNPLFVNAGGTYKDDYKITHDSPCIDVGTNSGAPLEDAWGTTRPVDGITDIGAHEKVPATIANVPGAPTVKHVSKNELRVIIDTNSNLPGVKYVIQETTTGKYINKITGALQVGEDWGTYHEFGNTIGKVIVGLTQETEYTFKVKARNTDLVETVYGDPASATTYLDQLYPDHPLSSLVHNLKE